MNRSIVIALLLGTLSVKAACNSDSQCGNYQCCNNCSGYPEYNTCDSGSGGQRGSCVDGWMFSASYQGCTQKVDCSGSWSSWGNCSQSCGGGEKCRTYNISTNRQGSGSSCNNSSGQKDCQSCNNHACPIDCVGYWGSWGNCSEQCGNGTKKRTYQISTTSQNGGQDCTNNSGQEESQSCNQGECANDCQGTWSDWTQCDAKCGGGSQMRTFTLNSESGSQSGCSRKTGATETQSCNAQSCKYDFSAEILSTKCIIKDGTPDVTKVTKKVDNRGNSNSITPTLDLRKEYEMSTTITKSEQYMTSQMINKGESWSISNNVSHSDSQSRSKISEIASNSEYSNTSGWQAGGKIEREMGGGVSIPIPGTPVAVGVEDTTRAGVEAGYQSETKFGSSNSSNHRDESLDTIVKMTEEMSSNSGSKYTEDLSSFMSQETHSETVTRTESIGYAVDLEVPPGACKEGVLVVTFNIGKGDCYQEIHFKATDAETNAVVKGDELKTLAKDVMPDRDIYLVQSNSDYVVYFNSLTVDGLVGEHRQEDQIFDCDCVPPNCEGGGGGDGGGGDSSCCTLPTATCLACKTGVSKETYCALYQGTQGCDTFENHSDECCLLDAAPCNACKNKMDVASYCKLVPTDVGCDSYSGGGSDGCCQLPVASCEACNARISEHEYCQLYPSTSGCGHNTGEEECCDDEKNYQCEACQLNMGEIDYCNFVGKNSEYGGVRDDCTRVIAAGNTGGGNYGEWCEVQNTKTGECMDGKLSATYLNAGKLGLMMATANYLI